MRSLLGRSRSNWIRVALATSTLVGLVFGFVGFGQLTPTSSFANRLYGSFQLLVLSGPSGIDGARLPTLLNLGRFLAAAGLVGTVATIFQRISAARADQYVARRAKNHIVVFGSSISAQQLAVARRRFAEPPQPTVVLVADVDAAVATALRHSHVRVVPGSDERRIAEALTDASEVLIAENEDARSLVVLGSTLDHFHQAESQQTDVIRVRVLLSSTALARELRTTWASRSTKVLVAAWSIDEAISQRLADSDWFPRVPSGASKRIVIVGDGALASATATSIIERHHRRGEMTHLDLVPVSAPEWCDQVVYPIHDSSLTVSVVTPTDSKVDPGTLAATRLALGSSYQHVIVVGLSDTDALAVGIRINAQVPEASLVTVLDTQMSALPTSNSTSSWRTASLSQLLQSPDMWAIEEHLGKELREGLRTISSLPGADIYLGPLAPLLQQPPSQFERWSVRLASALQLDLESLGYQIRSIAPHDDYPAFLTEPLQRMTTTVERLIVEAGCNLDDSMTRPVVLTVLQGLPDMLARQGLSLHLSNDVQGSAQALALSSDSVEQMAALLKAAYDHRQRADTTELASLSPAQWKALPESERESNRAQARNVPVKLLHLGYRIDAIGSSGTTLESIPDDALEELAWQEHLRWMYQQTRSGWTFGPVRDNDRRIHPCLIPYEELPHEQKENDRGPIRLIPQLLAIAELTAVRLTD